MKTKFKDVAGFYLGCECIINNDGVLRKMDTVCKNTAQFSPSKHKFTYASYDTFKPVLHPIDNIPANVLKEIFKACYKSVYGINPDKGVKIKMVYHGNDMGLKASEIVLEEQYDYGLTVDKNGIMFSVNGDCLNIPTFEVTTILTKGYVDIFSLIDNDEAISK